MGPRNEYHEVLGWPEIWLGTGRTGGREGERGDHEPPPLFVGRVLGQVRLYKEREREWGGGGRRTEAGNPR